MFSVFITKQCWLWLNFSLLVCGFRLVDFQECSWRLYISYPSYSYTRIVSTESLGVMYCRLCGFIWFKCRYSESISSQTILEIVTWLWLAVGFRRCLTTSISSSRRPNTFRMSLATDENPVSYGYFKSIYWNCACPITSFAEASVSSLPHIRALIYATKDLTHIRVGIATAWEGLLITDSIVFTLTLYKAIKEWKDGSSRLFHVLVRDGAFVVLSIHASGNWR